MRPAEPAHNRPENDANPQLPADLAQLAANLAALAPAPSRLDRGRLMFAAGRQSALAERRRPAEWIWPLSTAALALVSLGLAGALLHERGGADPIAQNAPPPKVNDVAVENRETGQMKSSAQANDTHRSPAVSNASPIAARQDSYFALRARVLAHGLDALPAMPVGAVGDPAPLRVHDGLRRMIGS